MATTRPSISRDTRLLLTIALVSVAMLWVLARIRFPDRSPTPNPVPPVLAQLAPPSALADVIATMAQLDTRLQPSVLALGVRHNPGSGGESPGAIAAVRFHDDLALAVAPEGGHGAPFVWRDATEIAWDPASSLAVVRVVGEAPSDLSISTPRRPSRPRFVIAASASDDGVSLRPVFVASLVERTSPIWSGPIWMLPADTDLPRGTPVFDVEGAWAGLVTRERNRTAIAPADRVLALADRMVREQPRPRGYLGVDVQEVTPALRAAGAEGGVIVSSIDPDGGAAGRVEIGDTIEAVDGAAMPAVEDWTARAARLSSGESITLRLRRHGDVLTVHLTARPEASARSNRPLGLTLRTVPATGAAIVRVDRGSAADAAGLQAGDVLTLVGEVAAPTAAQALRALAAMSRERPIVVGFTRREGHHLTALERTW